MGIFTKKSQTLGKHSEEEIESREAHIIPELHQEILGPSKRKDEAPAVLAKWRMADISWLKESPGEDEKENHFEPPSPSETWPDEPSREAEGRLRSKGIRVPWHYEDTFGAHYGETFGNEFKVLGLRVGGVGLVLIVESTMAGGKELYAAKTLNGFLKTDYLDLPIWRQEQISLAFLEEALPWLEMGQHPHILPVHLLQNIIHPQMKRNVPFVFSEFIHRGSLTTYLKGKGKLDLKESLALGIQLCDGLLHAYEHGLKAHRDLKPDNIMIYDDGVFKVADFSANVIGTPGYMAPEQVIAWWRSCMGVRIVLHDLPLDQRADQFAVGLIILESLLGRRPFAICEDACRSREKAMEYVEEGVGEVDDDSLPKSLKQILTCVFSPKPSDRIPDFSALRKELLGAYVIEFGRYNAPEVEIDDSAIWWFERGRAFSVLGYHNLAESPFKAASKGFSSIPGKDFPGSRAACSLNLGTVYFYTDRLKEAEAAYKDALVTYRSIHGSDIEQAICTMNLGNVFSRTSQFKEAEVAYTEALNIFSPIPETEHNRAVCVMNLGSVYHGTDRLSEAELAFKEALKIFRTIAGTEHEQATCIMNLAFLFGGSSRLQEAEKTYVEALGMLGSIFGTELDRANCWYNLGSIYGDMDRLQKAEVAYKKALALTHNVPGTERKQATCTMGLGDVYIRTGRFREAEEIYEGALKIYRSIPGTEAYQAECILKLGSVYRQTDRLNGAEAAYAKALEIFGTIPKTEVDQAEYTMNLGIAYRKTGLINEAEAAFARALKIYRKISGTEPAQANCLYNLGAIYEEIGRLQEAEKAFDDALRILNSIPKPNNE